MSIKDVYNVSLCKNGILGGLLYLKDTELIYCTNKLTVPEYIRRLHMRYSDILEIKQAPFHTVVVTMQSGETHRFLVFSQKRFLKNLRSRANKL